MSTKFMLTRDITGSAWDFNSVPFALDSFTGVLAATVAQSITVPSNYQNWEMRIQATNTAEVWVDGINTAVVPASTFSASTSELIANGEMRRYVKAGQVISFITGATDGARVSVQFFAAQNYTN